jgi:hypothetical protein
MNIRHLFLSLIGVALTMTALGLPMGEREIRHFEREVLKTLRELMTLEGEQRQNDYVMRLKKEVVRETIIDNAELTFAGLGADERQALKNGEGELESLKKTRITVAVHISTEEIQELITREMARGRPERQIISNIRLELEPGKARVRGMIHLGKVPGNPMAFLSQSPVPFAALVSVQVSGSLITIAIDEGEINGTAIPPETEKMLLAWINPIWDFSRLPYPAGISSLVLQPKGVSLEGYVFGK